MAFRFRWSSMGSRKPKKASRAHSWQLLRSSSWLCSLLVIFWHGTTKKKSTYSRHYLRTRSITRRHLDLNKAFSLQQLWPSTTQTLKSSRKPSTGSSWSTTMAGVIQMNWVTLKSYLWATTLALSKSLAWKRDQITRSTHWGSHKSKSWQHTRRSSSASTLPTSRFGVTIAREGPSSLRYNLRYARGMTTVRVKTTSANGSNESL